MKDIGNARHEIEASQQRTTERFGREALAAVEMLNTEMAKVVRDWVPLDALILAGFNAAFRRKEAILEAVALEAIRAGEATVKHDQIRRCLADERDRNYVLERRAEQLKEANERLRASLERAKN